MSLDNKELEKLANVSVQYFSVFKSIQIDIEQADERTIAAAPIRDGIASNIDALRVLALANHCNELYVVSRSLIERIITYLYLQYCSDKELKSYVAYAKQKPYRKLNNELTVNDKKVSLKFSGEINIEEDQYLKESLEEFTGKNSGREKTRWSSTSLINRLEVIDSSGQIKEADLSLVMLALNNIYDEASEALHATIYGCSFQYGHFDPNVNTKNEDEILKCYEGYMSSALGQSLLASGVVLSHMAEKFELTELEVKTKGLQKTVMKSWAKC